MTVGETGVCGELNLQVQNTSTAEYKKLNSLLGFHFAHTLVLNSLFIMLRASLWNLLVLNTLKVVPLELAMSSFLVCLFWVVLLECTTSSNIPLGSKVQWRDKTLL